MKALIIPILLLFLTSIGTVNGMSYPPEGYKLGTKQESPRHSFFVEIYGKETDGEIERCVWIVPCDKTHTPRLLAGPDVLTPLYGVDISVSPDERWILREQKLCHGENAVALYERDSDLHYKEIGPPIFSEQAWHFFSEQTRRPFTLDYRFIIRVSDWPTATSRMRSIALYGDGEQTKVKAPNNSSLLISLTGEDDKINITFWYCFYDLQKHRFYLDAALKKHNQDAIDTVEEHRR